MYEFDKDEFERVPLRVHKFLAGVPLRTLYRVDLPGGRAGMRLQEISDITGFGSAGEMEVGTVTKALFGLRGLIGGILHWDDAPALTASVTYLSHLCAEERTRSRIQPGTAIGISRVLYRFENEWLAEIVNRTVHCFWMMALERTANGYALYLAVYVKRLNWFTPVYMALITPMLRWIVYPAMIKGVRHRWEQAFPSTDGQGLTAGREKEGGTFSRIHAFLRSARLFKTMMAAWLAISFAALLLAPSQMPAGYSWLSHTASESAAQGIPGAWLARLGFLIFGLTVLGITNHLRDAWSTGGRWAHAAFGVCMVGVATFSTRAWAPEVVYDPVEDALHSFAATAMGCAFTIGVALRFLGRGPDAFGRVTDMVAAVAATAIPLAMLALSGWDGLLQRGMFAISYLWFALEAFRTHHRFS